MKDIMGEDRGLHLTDKQMRDSFYEKVSGGVFRNNIIQQKLSSPSKGTLRKSHSSALTLKCESATQTFKKAAKRVMRHLVDKGLFSPAPLPVDKPGGTLIKSLGFLSVLEKRLSLMN